VKNLKKGPREKPSKLKPVQLNTTQKPIKESCADFDTPYQQNPRWMYSAATFSFLPLMA
jgi:hypothetical protein